jgi:transposase-like protein
VPETQSARCRCHKIANVLDKVPKRLQSQAESQFHEVMYADAREHAREAVERFAEDFSSKYPKAVARSDDERDRLCDCARG